MKWQGRLLMPVCRNKRSDGEQARDRALIAALNNLKSLRAAQDGGMSIDLDEIRELLIATRHCLKQFVR